MSEDQLATDVFRFFENNKLRDLPITRASLVFDLLGHGWIDTMVIFQRHGVLDRPDGEWEHPLQPGAWILVGNQLTSTVKV